MIKPLVTRFVELDGTVPTVTCIVFLTMITHTDTTRASLAQGEGFACKVGMDPIVRCTVSPGMTLWRVTIAIHRGKKFVCGAGMEKLSAMSIVNKPMIQMLVMSVTQMGTKCVYRAGMGQLVIASQEMTRSWATRVILRPVEESVLEDGSVTIVMFSAYQGTILQVITLAIVALELRSVCPSGMV